MIKTILKERLMPPSRVFLFYGKMIRNILVAESVTMLLFAILCQAILYALFQSLGMRPSLEILGLEKSILLSCFISLFSTYYLYPTIDSDEKLLKTGFTQETVYRLKLFKTLAASLSIFGFVLLIPFALGGLDLKTLGVSTFLLFVNAMVLPLIKINVAWKFKMKQRESSFSRLFQSRGRIASTLVFNFLYLIRKNHKALMATTLYFLLISFGLGFYTMNNKGVIDIAYFLGLPFLPLFFYLLVSNSKDLERLNLFVYESKSMGFLNDLLLWSALLLLYGMTLIIIFGVFGIPLNLKTLLVIPALFVILVYFLILKFLFLHNDLFKILSVALTITVPITIPVFLILFAKEIFYDRS